MAFDPLGNALLAFGITLPRVIGAFLMLPLMTPETVPATVRNSFMASLALVAMPVALGGTALDAVTVPDWPFIVLKELFLGAAIGFVFGIVFWAFGAAGNLLDSQVGMALAAVFDPIQGHQTSLHGEFMSEFAAMLFMASGAFLIFLDLLISSYALWPVTSYYPELHRSGIAFFTGQFSYLMTTLLVLAAPAIVLMMLIDLSFGLVNRYAPQLNVFALTMPIKAWLATAVLMLSLGVYVEIVLERLGANRGLLEALRRLFA